MKNLALICLFLMSSVPAFAATGLVVHATELGVGKFHRMDNSVHAYGGSHAWTPYILPNDAATDKILVQKNADGSYTVFFSTLDELLTSVTQISKQENQKVSVFNLHGHGLPGQMWFPADAQTLASSACSDWRASASGNDADNYSQYYTAVPYREIMQIRSLSNKPNFRLPCTTGLREWQSSVAKAPEFVKVLADNVQIHMLSCVVGLGTLGENFTKGLAALLIPSGAGRVETSMDFGLGDWSMAQGMGFWDFQNQDQMSRDTEAYPKDRQDSEIAQKGTVRMVSLQNGNWQSTLLTDRAIMSLAFETSVQGNEATEIRGLDLDLPMPEKVQIPGTNTFLKVIAE